MTLEQILVAIDFSETSRQALEQAIALAKQHDAELTLLWVEDDSAMAPSGAAIYATAAREVEALLRTMRADAVAQLEALADEARAQGVRAEARAEHGDPAEVIVDAAGELNAGLVVTGTKGVTGFKRVFLGSVAAKVVRSCHGSVLVARGQARSFGRILVATDFSPASKNAVRLAVTLAAPDAEITLFHAWQYPAGTIGWNTTPTPTGGPLMAIRDETLEHARQQGEAWIAELSRPGVTMRFHQEYGAPAALIQDLLDGDRHDLVVTGTHGYRGVRRFLLGSVAESTVRHAPCSAAVAHGDSE